MARTIHAYFRQPPQPERGALLAAGWIYEKKAVGVGDVRSRVMSDYALVHLVEGGGAYEDERNGRRQVAAGDVIVVFPGLAHGYGRRDQPRWSECFLVFQGLVFRQLEEIDLISRRRPVLSPGIDRGVRDSFAALIRDFEAGAGSDQRVLAARIHLLIAEIVRLHERRMPAAADAIARACAALEERLEHPLDLESVAASLGMGYGRFRKQFAREVGVPPARFRLQRRIDQAKTLLVEGTTIARVAERLGYCDAFYFARQFKQVTGVTPAAFRRSFTLERS